MPLSSMYSLLPRGRSLGLNALLKPKRAISIQRYATAGVNGVRATSNSGESTGSEGVKVDPYGAKSTGLGDESGFLGNGDKNDWSKSYFGLSVEPFSKDVSDILLAPVDPLDVEMKPDGLLYLPEIKYRRVLNKAFGPGGWGLAPRSETNVTSNIVSREYALVCLGRLVGIARGEQQYFDSSGIATAAESCKSNALMRCCKDLGVASELWDPRFIREFKAQHCVQVMVQNNSGQKKKLWRRKDQPKFEFPWREI